MGLIKAAAGAVGGVLADQWKEYFYCEALSANVLVSKGAKRVSGRSSNTKGEENIITTGSVIAVADGQCMIVVEQGRVLDVCAEPGAFTFSAGGEPSLFAGAGLGAGALGSLKSAWDRFKFGGSPGKDTRVYYFNTKEVPGNKYGTPSPVPFRVVDTRIGLDLDISIRCSGEYSYQLQNPILFYTNVCGNVEADYTRDKIDSQIKSELISALRPALAKISALGIRYSELPLHEEQLRDTLNELMSEKWRNLRGIEMVSFTMPNAAISDEDLQRITKWQEKAMLTNPAMAAATLVGAQADAMLAAANNEGGAMMGFMGLGMAQAAGGMNAQSLFQMGQPVPPPQQAAAPAAPPAPAAPAAAGWQCACGALNQGKFCSECAKPKPKGAPLYRCDKCGFVPPDPLSPPKFCPECGDAFDDKDTV
ncbi:MAG: SPFH domain-containing protein [Oscillospiraceae bacterium]|jgi:membrane protease subunit (stomatin/prohibitin family)|nr:SPFH domain-containing protein [Oscillospiraceae bacterium]